MLVLGVETSCDETAAAVVEGARTVRSNAVFSQVSRHRDYGGVVPEIAARCHVEVLPDMIAEAVSRAGVAWGDLGAVAVTCGPGLPTALLTGLSAARALGLALGRPVHGVNHLEGHLLSVFLAPDAPPVAEACPMLLLLVTGGHTLLVRVDGVGRYRLLGQTLDDAAGEALDKGASVLKLGYPGGPEIERAAQGGDPARVRFPRGLEQGGGGEIGGLARALCFSYSGLKTALLYKVREDPGLLAGDRFASLAASYQEAVFDALLIRIRRALERHPDARSIACVGGVAKNARLRGLLDDCAARHRVRLLLAPLAYCTDNAAMIAAAAAMRIEAGLPLLPAAEIDPNLPLAPKSEIPNPKSEGSPK
jgi:N6-L-threonylcarbamoyladenine synthase